MERKAPSLSDEQALADASRILDYVEQGYIVGMSRAEVLLYVALGLKNAFACGAIAELEHVQERLK